MPMNLFDKPTPPSESTKAFYLPKIYQMELFVIYLISGFVVCCVSLLIWFYSTPIESRSYPNLVFLLVISAAITKGLHTFLSHRISQLENVAFHDYVVRNLLPYIKYECDYMARIDNVANVQLIDSSTTPSGRYQIHFLSPTYHPGYIYKLTITDVVRRISPI